MSLHQPPEFLPTPGKPTLPWTQWHRLFKNYLLASGSDVHSSARRKALLLHCLGVEGQRLYYALPHTAGKEESGPSDEYDAAVATLDAYFTAKTNIVVERHRFGQRTQLPGETAAAFVTALRELALSCNFGEQTDDFIRDQLVAKTSNHVLRERLLLEGTSLTLERALTISNNIEEATKYSLELQSSAASIQKVDKHQMPARTEARMPSSQHKACFRCGSSRHLADSKTCKARDKTCSKCGKRGHFQRVCRSGMPDERALAVREVDTCNISEDLNVLLLARQKKAAIHVDTLVQDVPVRLLVDTGSAVSILSAVTYSRLKCPPVQPTSAALYDFSRRRISTEGCLTAPVFFQGRHAEILFYVVKGGTDILGIDAIEALRLHINGMSLQCTNITQAPQGLDPELFSEFSTLFDGKLGLAANFIHKVKIRQGVTPVAAKLRRLPFSVRDAVREELQRLEQNDVIEKVDASEWVSPIVVVAKKNGKIRICVDLREPNKAVVIDKFPLPHTEELLHKLHGAKYFSKIDLAAAYHQVLLSPESRELTTFITDSGLYRFKRVCFGLASAPSAFQKMMVTILQKCKNTLCYIDDVIVFGSTPEEHFKNLKQVLHLIAKSGLKLNDKCIFNVQEIEFLGHMISHQGIRPLQSNIDAIKAAPAPTDISTLRSFLGMVGYYAKFVPDYAVLVEPLRELLRKNSTFTWNPARQACFEQLKSTLSTRCLQLFDPVGDIIVTTDASSIGLGAVLQQTRNDELVTISFASRRLTPQEQKYSVGELEALACLWACEHWRVYLWGRPFTLRTDHQALTTLLSTKGVGRRPFRIARWHARLLAYNFTIEFQKGDKNTVADALSRMPLPVQVEEEETGETVCVVSPCVTHGEFVAETMQDQLLQQVMKWVTSTWPAVKTLPADAVPFYRVRTELSVVGDLLLRGDKFVAPSSLVGRLLDAAHESHPGITRTKQRLREQYWWPAMCKQVEQLIASCGVCQSVDKSAKPVTPPLQPVAFPSAPWQKLGIDIVGPFANVSADCRFAITAIDYFSKWPEVCFAARVTATTVISFLRSIFSREGYPDEIVSDHGPQFTACEFDSFLKERSITHTYSAVYHPQANGQVERFNRVLKEYVQVCTRERRSLKEAITEYLGVYRFTPHATTGVKPSVLLHGRHPRTKLDLVGAPGKQFFQDPHAAMEAVRSRVKQKQQASKTYTDRRRAAKQSPLTTGQPVRIRLPDHVPKGAVSYSSPFTIIDQCGQDTYKLSDGRTWNRNRLVPCPRPATPVESSCCDSPNDSDDAPQPSNLGASVSRDLPELRRSTRLRRPPSWLKDYERH